MKVKIEKGYQQKRNGGSWEPISETKYNELIAQYDATCEEKTIIDDTEDYLTILYRFRGYVIYIGWCFVPVFY